MYICTVAGGVSLWGIEIMAQGGMKMAVKAALCMALLWLSVPAAFAGDIESTKMAAERGDAEAQYNLDLMYYNGRGVPQDYIQAHLWLNLAAASSSPDDAEARKKAAETRDGLATIMTPAQIAEAQRLAREWKPE